MTYDNLIDGAWVGGGELVANLNPSDTAEVVGEYRFATAAQAQDAIAAARAAFPAWARGPIQARADMLDRIGTEILARSAELGQLLSREEGKPLAEGIGEVVRAGNIFKFFAGEVLRSGGETLPSVRPGIGVEISREPVGVVALITPWNFPIAIPAWKIAPALAYGNCVVFKPAELTPGSAWALADIIARSGVPAGVFNLVMGRGDVVGAVLSASPYVDAISFTGSQAVGRRVAAQAVANMTKLQLEMGGKNPQVILDDADLDTAVTVSLQSAFYSTGQRCTAASRLIVTDAIHDRFVAALGQRVQALQVGHALQAGTEIGPVVDQRQLDKNLEYIASARADGARLVAGGARLERATRGFYLAPALFADTTPSMRLNREEVFGPVAGVIRVRDYEEALALANDTPFGLTAGIATTSLKYASHFRRNAQVGMVMVNVPTAGVDYHVPFGGRKGSSYGAREQGRHAAEFYTTVKTAYIAPC
ncbi:aldehyde dehydrogenase family protein [Janthinobacterium psychrotolerans]|uniref:aldehyde dehydrogenase (NAD(+)) n=1 Tax=Janthinobacterium psychrotolerans TaxID=1747903 RepID=A0A1A7BXX3_9BURK|nr:aldehyde dehydrogenase family protein [Janthinobacterium psychrotolerans]OBV38471.1 aldehyde dehydrogenase (NAD+) [Janthinobacterium psychrotolerans]